MIARTAFSKNSNQDRNAIHSPITFKNTGIHLLSSSKLTVFLDPNQETSKSLLSTPFEQFEGPTSSYSPEQSLSPVSPTSLFHSTPDVFSAFSSPEGFIEGLPSHLDHSTRVTDLCKLQEYDENSNRIAILSIDPNHFKSGSVVIYRTWVLGSGISDEINLSPTAMTLPLNKGSNVKDMGSLERLWTNLGMDSCHRTLGISMMIKMSQPCLSGSSPWNSNLIPGLQDAIQNLSLEEFNVVLYKVNSEERDCTDNVFGVYNVPGYGGLPYCGLEGFKSILSLLGQSGDLGHPFCANLRKGLWACDSVVNRLSW